ncbi:MAG: hypothetical protein K0R31_2285, partial [Clostridiales bacterium]|nr:hypothetical protein [Clostridiales bacterium]
METLSNLMMGLSVAMNPNNLLFCGIGVVFGVIIGALPGIGPSAGIAILIPLTFGADPVAGIIMLAGIYYGAMYGGSITSILINTPGDAASVMTTLDGYPMARNGRAGAALGMSAFASFIAGTGCVVAFMFLAPWLAKFALGFGPQEYFALMALGLTTVSGFTGKVPSKGYISALLGLFLATVGLDVVQGIPRYTFGAIDLFDGIDFVPVAMGLFGIVELVTNEEEDNTILIDKKEYALRTLFPNKQDWKDSIPHILAGTGVGFSFGMLPGSGATICS